MLDSAMIDGLYEHIKKAIAVFTPLDPSLPDGEWMMEYNQLSLINEFQTALIVLNQDALRRLGTWRRSRKKNSHDHIW